MQRLLQEKATLLLSPKGRSDLQYFLAPLLCKNQAEQQQFYQIYQDYLKIDLAVPPVTNVVEDNNWWYKIELCFVFLLVVTLCGEWYRQLTTVSKIPPKVQFIYPPESISVGDSIFVKNTSTPINNAGILFNWELLDIHTGQVIQQQVARNFTFTVPPSRQHHQKKIRLIAIDSSAQQVIGGDSSTVLIKCQNPPEVGAITALDTLFVPFHPLPFSVAVSNKESVTYEWDFGDGTKDFTATPVHIYQQNGYYQLKVTVSDTLSEDGVCTKQVQTAINIQGKKKQAFVPLITFDLLKEPPLISNPIKLWALLLLFLLLLSSLWAWWKWSNRPFPEVVPKNNFIESSPQSTRETLKEKTQPTKLQFSLANQLRLRQNGPQQIIDVLPTVHQTIKKGGFPNLQYKYKKQPTEYLVLIPKVAVPTIALQLFDYLIAFFQEQAVFIDLFFYKNDSETVWNADYPKGVTIDKLQQLFPQHRLIGYLPKVADQLHNNLINHELLQTKAFQNWSKKVVLQTPTAFASSAITLDSFTISLASIQQAIYQLNQLQPEEKITILAPKEKPTTSSKNWTSLTDYEQQLIHQPNIFRWFKALVIHPFPTINSILAIGQALKMSLDYDSLLTVSVLPNFQEATFDRSLWRNIWDTFPKAEEQQVRKALKASLLTQVERSTKPTNNPLNTLIAIQNFGIDPTDFDHQEQVRYLLKKQQFSDLQLEELDIIITRQIANYRSGHTIGETVANYLADVPQKIPTTNRPWATFYFWLATSLSFLGLVWMSILYLSPSGMHRHTIEQPKNEAAKWNNIAVNQYTLAKNDIVPPTALTTNYRGFNAVSTSTAHYLTKAIAADSTFEKAAINFQKLQYNDGIAYYQQFFKQRGEQLQLAKKQFNAVLNTPAATQDSVQFAARFALAHIYHLLNEPDSVCALINLLKDQPNLAYLDHTDFLPQQINYCATNPTKIHINGQVVDAVNALPLANVSVNGTNFNSLTSQNGQFQGAIILSKTNKQLTLQFNLTKYQTIHKKFPIISDSLDLGIISLAILPPNPIVSPLIVQNQRATVLNTFDFLMPEMILVPGGSFLMGCSETAPNYCQPDESPAHEVLLDSFEMGIYEVTNEEFAVFINDYGSQKIKQGADAGKPLTIPTPWGLYQKEDKTWTPNKGYEKHPIVLVGYASATAYCQWLSQKTGQIWRLPTEAEWEYAARGGQKGKRNNFLYSGGNDLEAVAWSGIKKTQHPNYGTNAVGQKRPNALGIYDMSGNVFEWCFDWYQADFYGASDGQVINPICQKQGERRILRGGSWHPYTEKDCRITDRIAVKFHSGGIAAGFRCVRVLTTDLK